MRIVGVLPNFSCHHKWNEAWLLVINWYIRVAPRVAKWLKARDIRKLGKFRIMSKVHGSIT